MFEYSKFHYKFEFKLHSWCL